MIEQLTNKMGDKNFVNSSYISSLILEEIKENPIDLITVVCKDGEEVIVSCLLLAAISPYLARLFKTAENEEIILLLPDIDILDLLNITNTALKGKLSSLVAGDSLSKLDGVFWNLSCPKNEDEVELNDIDIDSLELSTVEVSYQKAEPLSDHEDDLFSSSTTPTKKRKHPNNTANPPQNTVVKKRGRPPKKKIDPTENITKSDNYENGNNLEDFFSENKIVEVKKRGRPFKKKTTASNDSLISNSDVDFDTFDDNNHEVQSDNENDPDFIIGNLDEIESKPKRVKTEFEIEVTPQSEEFCTAQQKLKIDIEDENNLEDPYLLWFKYHDLNPRIYFNKKQKKDFAKCLCPVCPKNHPEIMHKKKFAVHLRGHKYANYNCNCESQKELDQNQIKESKGALKRKKREHILLEHWGWKRCSYYESKKCTAILPESQHLIHLFRKHDEKQALKCVKCCRNFKLAVLYYKHMDDNHSSEVDHTCDCKDIVFKSFLHRKHHMQVAHIKEKLGCYKCYFLCSTQAVMDEHVNKKHMKPKDSLTSVHKHYPIEHVCDECGSVFKSLAIVKNHKLRMHDTVLVQCTLCPVKLSKAGLYNHMYNVHNQGVCKICGIEVTALSNHMTKEHYNKGMTFKCEHCPEKVFKSKNSLNRHTMSIHLKEKPYNCRFGCDVAYNDACNRNAHERRVHGKLYEVKRNRFSQLNQKSSIDSYKSTRATEVNNVNSKNCLE